MNCLLASTLWGGVYLILLFGICLGSVAGIKLLLRSAAKKRGEEPLPPAKPEPPKEPEKIYYIVEKKRTRRKTERYGEPKKIRFDR